MKKFVVTAKLSDDSYHSVTVEEVNAYNAIVDGANELGCYFADIVSIIMVP